MLSIAAVVLDEPVYIPIVWRLDSTMDVKLLRVLLTPVLLKLGSVVTEQPNTSASLLAPDEDAKYIKPDCVPELRVTETFSAWNVLQS